LSHLISSKLPSHLRVYFCHLSIDDSYWLEIVCQGKIRLVLFLLLWACQQCSEIEALWLNKIYIVNC
jgi:hypothetical protein